MIDTTKEIIEKTINKIGGGLILKSNQEHIAKIVFGRVTGLPYTFKNLQFAVKNNLKIIDTSVFSGFAFIRTENGRIHCSKSQNETWKDFCFTPEEFWNATKSRKSKIAILLNNKRLSKI